MSEGALPGSIRERRPARLPLRRLVEQARAHGRAYPALDLETPADRGLPFVPAGMTPLYYTAMHGELTPEEALRYNQLSALSFNELITFLEEEVAAAVLPAIAREPGVAPDLLECLRLFEEEERRHAGMWRALNRWAEPEWYRETAFRFVLPSRPLRAALRWICNRPARFPVVLWIMLVQEELSLAAARRYAADGPRIEPRFAAAYRLHGADEVRHVQVDWHLIERFHGQASARARRLNAAAFRFILREFLLSPSRMTLRVVRRLVDETPRLRTALPRIDRELRSLVSDPLFQAMLYSRESHPISFFLFDRYPELHAMREAIRSYEPHSTGGAA